MNKDKILKICSIVRATSFSISLFFGILTMVSIGSIFTYAFPWVCGAIASIFFGIFYYADQVIDLNN